MSKTDYRQSGAAPLLTDRMTECTAFFYGTLMHPKVLKAVIRNDGSHLETCPAILLNHTRHRVKSADYPGVVPLTKGQELFNRELTQEEGSVRGTLVKGLTAGDMKYLDDFEGDEYIKRPIQAHPLGPFVNVASHEIDEDNLLPAEPAPLQKDLAPAIEAQTYIYCDHTMLDAHLWSFEEFVKVNAWKWYGGTR